MIGSATVNLTPSLPHTARVDAIRREADTPVGAGSPALSVKITGWTGASRPSPGTQQARRLRGRRGGSTAGAGGVAVVCGHRSATRARRGPLVMPRARPTGRGIAPPAPLRSGGRPPERRVPRARLDPHAGPMPIPEPRARRPVPARRSPLAEACRTLDCRSDSEGPTSAGAWAEPVPVASLRCGAGSQRLLPRQTSARPPTRELGARRSSRSPVEVASRRGPDRNRAAQARDTTARECPG